MTQVPFYADWQFWAFFVAAIAVLLSQLPPIYSLLKKGKLSCEAVDQLFINHSYGVPQGQWHLFIENVGGRSVRLSSISVTFTKLEGESFTLPVRGYLDKPTSNEAIMFTPVRLEAGQTWGHVVNFFTPLTRDEDRAIRGWRSRIRADIGAQRAIPENKEKYCEATDKAAVAGLVQFQSDHYKWLHGEYALNLRLATNSGEVLEQRYAFTLFESDSKELAGHAERYRFGEGVFFPSDNVKGLLVPVRKG